MYQLYHQIFCPFSRKVRAVLLAKKVPFILITEDFWQRRKEFIALNPAITVPVLFNQDNNHIIANSFNIIEYLEEKYSHNPVIGRDLEQKSEARRIALWFDEKFFNEVGKHIIYEKYFKRFIAKKSLSPDSIKLKIASDNLVTHLNYIEFLTENRRYLAGNELSIADFAAASHISVLDYFGNINWRNHPIVKEWYCLVKSHKSFSTILNDRVANIEPPYYYSELDF